VDRRARQLIAEGLTWNQAWDRAELESQGWARPMQWPLGLLIVSGGVLGIGLFVGLFFALISAGNSLTDGDRLVMWIINAGVTLSWIGLGISLVGIATVVARSGWGRAVAWTAAGLWVVASAQILRAV
jgi:hypothetical protein